MQEQQRLTFKSYEEGNQGHLKGHPNCPKKINVGLTSKNSESKSCGLAKEAPVEINKLHCHHKTLQTIGLKVDRCIYLNNVDVISTTIFSVFQLIIFMGSKTIVRPRESVSLKAVFHLNV